MNTVNHKFRPPPTSVQFTALQFTPIATILYQLYKSHPLLLSQCCCKVLAPSFKMQPCIAWNCLENSYRHRLWTDSKIMHVLKALDLHGSLHGKGSALKQWHVYKV